MNLVDIRRLAIKKQLKIHFRLKNGMECVVNEEGVARVPDLRAIPDFNVEEELSAAQEFLVEPAPPAPPRTVSRADLGAMMDTSPTAAAHHDEDE